MKIQGEEKAEEPAEEQAPKILELIKSVEATSQKVEANSKSLLGRGAEKNILKDKLINIIHDLKMKYLELESGELAEGHESSETDQLLHDELITGITDRELVKNYMTYLLLKYKLNELYTLLDNYNKFMGKKTKDKSKRKLNSLIAEAHNNEYIKRRLKFNNTAFKNEKWDDRKVKLDETIIERGKSILIEIVNIIE